VGEEMNPHEQLLKLLEDGLRASPLESEELWSTYNRRCLNDLREGRDNALTALFASGMIREFNINPHVASEIMEVLFPVEGFHPHIHSRRPGRGSGILVPPGEDPLQMLRAFERVATREYQRVAVRSYLYFCNRDGWIYERAWAPRARELKPCELDDEVRARVDSPYWMGIRDFELYYVSPSGAWWFPCWRSIYG